MPIPKHFRLAATLLGTIALASCTAVDTTTAAHRFPADKRVVLETKLQGSEGKRLLADAHARFGGYDPAIRNIGSGVSGAVIVSVNGQHGPRRARDPRGAFVGETTISLHCEPGPLKLVVKPLHFQDGSSDHDELVVLDSKPGHRYFVGYAGSNVGGSLRWVPVIYNRTEQKIVTLPNRPRLDTIPKGPAHIHLPLPIYLR
jgi:hypothetical protein